MTLSDVSPAIVAQLSEDVSEVFWFCWDRETDKPWRSMTHGCVCAYAFESDATYVCGQYNGEIGDPHCGPLNAVAREATIQEAASARAEYLPIGLFDRDDHFIRRLA